MKNIIIIVLILFFNNCAINTVYTVKNIEKPDCYIDVKCCYTLFNLNINDRISVSEIIGANYTNIDIEGYSMFVFGKTYTIIKNKIKYEVTFFKTVEGDIVVVEYPLDFTKRYAPDRNMYYLKKGNR